VKLPRPDELDGVEALLDDRSAPCASVYMPIDRSGPWTRENPIRLKNLARRVETELGSWGRGTAEIEQLLRPVTAVVSDPGFWNQPGEGLALFLSDSFARHARLPLRVGDGALVGRRFHLRPLLGALERESRYLLLALSHHTVKLFRASRSSIEELPLVETPASFREVVGRRTEERQQLQFHTGTPGVGGRERSAVFHGHGGTDNEDENELRKFMAAVAHGIAHDLRDTDLPLVAVGPEKVVATYREVATHSRWVEGALAVNPFDLAPDRLREESWSIVEPVLRREELAARERLASRLPGGLASTELDEVVWAAEDGRVDTLFVDASARIWGKLDTTTRSVELVDGPGPDRDELIDLAVACTLRQRGRVYVEDAGADAGAEGDSPVAAVYRF
jgi:hypothetical protein